MADKTIKIGKKEFYNVEALAGMLFIPVDTVRKYIRKGKIKAIKVGKRYLVSKENLEAFLEGIGWKWKMAVYNREEKREKARINAQKRYDKQLDICWKKGLLPKSKLILLKTKNFLYKMIDK